MCCSYVSNLDGKVRKDELRHALYCLFSQVILAVMALMFMTIRFDVVLLILWIVVNVDDFDDICVRLAVWPGSRCGCKEGGGNEGAGLHRVQGCHDRSHRHAFSAGELQLHMLYF